MTSAATSIDMQIANGGPVGDDAFTHYLSSAELVKARRDYAKVRDAALAVCGRLGLDWDRAQFDRRVVVDARGWDDAYTRATLHPIQWVDGAHSLYRDLMERYR